MSRDGWMKKRANAGGDNGWAERGGYMAAKVSKLDEQFREKQREGSCSTLFSGVAIYVNGYTDPSTDELRKLMLLHGGQFHTYYSRSKTTHVVASNLPNSKIKELKGEKVVRPEWLTDSITAGRLLPYSQYQLYAKHKGPLFPGTTLRPTSELAAPSPQPNLHLPPRGMWPFDPEQSSTTGCPNNRAAAAAAAPGHSRPPSVQHGSAAARFVRPAPSHSASGHLITDPRHRSPLHPLSNPGHTKHPHKSPHCAPPQEGDFKGNGSLQTSSDRRSHPKRSEIQECGKEGARLAGVLKAAREAALTNGHSHLVNGALKPEDRPPFSANRDVPEHRVRPRSPPPQLQAKPDPYEFPHSPPKQSDPSPAFLEPPDSRAANEPKPKSPQSTDPEAARATGSQLAPKQPGPAVQADVTSDKNPSSPTSPSRPPVRPNGSHRDALSPDPTSLNTSNITAKPHSPSDKAAAAPASPAASAKSSARLLEQTGGLISEFYSHSRLHQISTWRTGFSEYVNQLNSKRKVAGSACFPGRDALRKAALQRATHGHGSSAPPSVKSCILHVDMDCFFVSVGIRHRAELQGKPVAVTSSRGQARVPLRPGANPQVEQEYYQKKHSHPHPEAAEDELHRTSPSQESPPSRRLNGLDQDSSAPSMAEIASCSYEARQAGVRNGMFFGKAKQLCPSLQSVPYDFEAYKEVALTMYETLAGYTHDIEALSCDEVLIDGSALLAEAGVGPEDLARAVRADIKERTGCCASVGMGSNILLARLATRKAKPDGQYLLKPENVDDFIRDLPVTSLPGVGPVMGRKLAAMGVRSCGDLQQVALTQLQKKFGPRTGQTLFHFCRGLDDRPVRHEKERKSVSAEMNYNIRFAKVDEAECFLTNLSMEVQKRLREAGLRGRRVTLKVMVRKVGAPPEPAKYGGHGICDNLAKTVMLGQPTDCGLEIAAAVVELFHAMKLQVQDLRGVGIQVQCLEGSQSGQRDPKGHRTRSIKQMLFSAKPSNGDVIDLHQGSPAATKGPRAASSPVTLLLADPVPGTSQQPPACRQAPTTPAGKQLNLSIEVPSPSQVDRSVLEALPADLRQQVELSWKKRDERANNCHSPGADPPAPAAPPPAAPPPPAPPSCVPALYTPPAGSLLLQIPNEPDSPGILLELPNFSQVDPDVFAALPKELQEELKSAYRRVTNIQPQARATEPKNPLLQLQQPGVGRAKRRYKRKNPTSPVRKGASPRKRRGTAGGLQPAVRSLDLTNALKTGSDPSTSASRPMPPAAPARPAPRPAPTLAGACDLTEIRTLIREWVTTMSDPMEEDILQVVKFCTELIDDKDLEKLDLVMKSMKRIMQQSAESVWSMAFDFILDNVQVVMQQAYGSTLKIS